VQTAAELAAAHGVRVILNPAPAQPLSDDLLSLVSVLTPNESEAELLTGTEVADEARAVLAADQLRSKGVATAIVTLGSQGAMVASDDFSGPVSAFDVKPVDTTAAGDVFNGALAVALSEGETLELAVKFASAAAALAVTELGAQPSAPGRKEIERLLASA
jgi:ribokinase